jgi:predicted DNA-binding protein (MmcQ/YjbR family)
MAGLSIAAVNKAFWPGSRCRRQRRTAWFNCWTPCRQAARYRGGGYDMAMDTDQLKAFCATLPGATATLHGAPANILTYAVGGKRFAHFKTSEPEQWRFSFKVSPERFVELTDIPGIKPARWLGRYRWVTVVDVRTVPEAYLTELVRWSYDAALATLSKARQRQIRTG